jgi:hypothetical protein
VAEVSSLRVVVRYPRHSLTSPLGDEFPPPNTRRSSLRTAGQLTAVRRAQQVQCAHLAARFCEGLPGARARLGRGAGGVGRRFAAAPSQAGRRRCTESGLSALGAWRRRHKPTCDEADAVAAGKTARGGCGAGQVQQLGRWAGGVASGAATCGRSAAQCGGTGGRRPSAGARGDVAGIGGRAALAICAASSAAEAAPRGLASGTSSTAPRDCRCRCPYAVGIRADHPTRERRSGAGVGATVAAADTWPGG